MSAIDVSWVIDGDRALSNIFTNCIRAATQKVGYVLVLQIRSDAIYMHEKFYCQKLKTGECAQVWHYTWWCPELIEAASTGKDGHLGRNVAPCPY